MHQGGGGGGFRAKLVKLLRLILRPSARGPTEYGPLKKFVPVLPTVTAVHVSSTVRVSGVGVLICIAPVCSHRLHRCHPLNASVSIVCHPERSLTQLAACTVRAGFYVAAHTTRSVVCRSRGLVRLPFFCFAFLTKFIGKCTEINQQKPSFSTAYGENLKP